MRKNEENNKETNLRIDSIYWLVIVLLIIGGVVANAYYAQVAWALRAAIGIVITIIIVFIALQTTQGKLAWTFIKGARMEMRKVVWPTRQETIRTTMVVIGMVLVVSLVLWGFDSGILWFVSWLTG